VLVFPTKDLELAAVSLVCDAKSDPGPKEAHVTVHEVIHRILQFGYKSLQVDKIVIDQVIRSNLHSNITLDQVDGTSDTQLEVLAPDALDLPS
jgi:hypothetical protein